MATESERARISIETPYLLMAPVFAIMGIGIGATMAPMTAAVMNAVGPERAGLGSATTNSAREVGGVFGIVEIVLVVIFVVVVKVSDHYRLGLRDGLARSIQFERLVLLVVEVRHDAPCPLRLEPGSPMIAVHALRRSPGTRPLTTPAPGPSPGPASLPLWSSASSTTR